jgi:hypothetical protein
VVETYAGMGMLASNACSLDRLKTVRADFMPQPEPHSAKRTTVCAFKSFSKAPANDHHSTMCDIEHGQTRSNTVKPVQITWPVLPLAADVQVCKVAQPTQVIHQCRQGQPVWFVHVSSQRVGCSRGERAGSMHTMAA